MYQKKKDKRSIQSSIWIYDALKDLMNTKDYTKITVTDIVNKANLGRTTFYRNFSTIDDVLQMKCEYEFNEFRQYCINYFRSTTTESKTFLRPFLRYWYDNSEIIELLIKANRESLLKEYLTKEVLFFVERSSINKNTVIYEHLNYFVAIRVADSMSILTEWIKNNKNLTPDELADIITYQYQESLGFNSFF